MAISAGMLTENNIYTFVYDGVYWNVLGDITQKNVMIKTTAEWAEFPSYIAPEGTILVYSDNGTIIQTINNQEVPIGVPSIKISDGATPAIDLLFVDEDVRNHISNEIIHITAAERNKWNNKLNCNDEVINNNLILTRN